MAYRVQVLLSSCTYKICRGNWNLTHHIPLSAGLDRIHNGRQLVALDIRTGSGDNSLVRDESHVERFLSRGKINMF
jgi:hypothetical protein